MDLFNSICQALGFGIAVGVLCGAILPLRLRLPFAASIATATAGLWLRAEDVTFWPMLPIGLIGMFAAGVSGEVFAGASRREALQGDSAAPGRRSVPLLSFGVALAVLVAGLGYLVPPTTIVWTIAIFILHLRRRRAQPDKHEGLRILR